MKYVIRITFILAFIFLSGSILEGESSVFTTCRNELTLGLNGLPGRSVPVVTNCKKNGTLIAGTPATSSLTASLNLTENLDASSIFRLSSQSRYLPGLKNPKITSILQVGQVYRYPRNKINNS